MFSRVGTKVCLFNMIDIKPSILNFEPVYRNNKSIDSAPIFEPRNRSRQTFADQGLHGLHLKKRGRRAVSILRNPTNSHN